MEKKVEVEVSARHVHLTKNDYGLLFGFETPFKEMRELSQKKEYVTDKEVKIIGSKGEVEARFLSPFRAKSQVELSMTDCFDIGVNAPYEVNASDGATEVTIKGAAGEISRKAAIIAKRHLHLNAAQARELGLKDSDEITVCIKTSRGRIVMSDVEVKIARNYDLRIHLDTDEGNAAGISGKCFGELII